MIFSTLNSAASLWICLKQGIRPAHAIKTIRILKPYLVHDFQLQLTSVKLNKIIKYCLVPGYNFSSQLFNNHMDMPRNAKIINLCSMYWATVLMQAAHIQCSVNKFTVAIGPPVTVKLKKGLSYGFGNLDKEK